MKHVQLRLDLSSGTSAGTQLLGSRARIWDVLFGKRTVDGVEVDHNGVSTGMTPALTGAPDLIGGGPGKIGKVGRWLKGLVGGNKAKSTSTSLVPLADEVLEQSIYLEGLGKIETIGNYSIYGNQALVGEVYIRNVLLIKSSAKPFIKGFKTLVGVLEAQARAAGAKQLQVTGLAVKNNGFFKANLARLLGFEFRQVNAETMLLTKILK